LNKNDKLNFNKVARDYLPTETKYLYIDKTFDNRGIDYKKFIKLRFASINHAHINKYYGVKGWYILWYLMINAIKSEYIKTSVSIIAEDTKLTTTDVKAELLKLNSQNVIILSKTKNINNNSPIEIYITYNTDYYNNFDDDNGVGYRAIPIDYIKAIFTSIDYKQWAVLSCMMTSYSYYNIKPKDEDGKMIYNYQRNHYSFMTQRQMADATGLTKSTVNRQITILENSKFNIISTYCSYDTKQYYDEDENKLKWKISNKIYHVNLFEQVEYVYYHIYLQMSEKEKTRNKNITKRIKNNFEEIAKSSEYIWITERDYMIAYYNTYIIEFENCLKDKDIEYYKNSIRKLKIEK